MVVERLTEESLIDIHLDRVQVHREIRDSFKQNLRLYITKLSCKKAKEVREDIDFKDRDSNIRY